VPPIFSIGRVPIRAPEIAVRSAPPARAVAAARIAKRQASRIASRHVHAQANAVLEHGVIFQGFRARQFASAPTVEIALALMRHHGDFFLSRIVPSGTTASIAPAAMASRSRAPSWWWRVCCSWRAIEGKDGALGPDC
jgi:hypothetical protein